MPGVHAVARLPAEARPDDGVGPAVHDRREHRGVVGGAVLQVGVVDENHIRVRGERHRDARPHGRTLAEVHAVPHHDHVGSHLERPQLVATPVR